MPATWASQVFLFLLLLLILAILVVVAERLWVGGGLCYIGERGGPCTGLCRVCEAFAANMGVAAGRAGKYTKYNARGVLLRAMILLSACLCTGRDV